MFIYWNSSWLCPKPKQSCTFSSERGVRITLLFRLTVNYIDLTIIMSYDYENHIWNGPFDKYNKRNISSMQDQSVALAVTILLARCVAAFSSTSLLNILRD